MEFESLVASGRAFQSLITDGGTNSSKAVNLHTCFIDPDKEILLAYNCNYYLTHQFKHVFCMFKRTVSPRRFFSAPTTYV